ncbi:MAG TPA: hypothetical protein VHW70_13675 [Edaphobacter sp.]|jgi:hypothetical protein|nr:hypothetical protein [Edaphobacter sp.]
MAITKKSLIGKTSAKNSTKKTAAAKAAGPVTPGKMVPAMRLAKAQLQTAKAGMQTGMIARF